MKVKIVTKTDWPSFMNVATQMKKALGSYCTCTISDWSNVESGGNIIFVGTVLRQTLQFLGKFLEDSRVVFYGTTEGHSFLDAESLKIANLMKIVAVSSFVKQMLEEIGIQVAGVVHHGLDMDNRRVDTGFFKSLRKEFNNKNVIFTASANHSRKGLDTLLRSYRLVDQEIDNAYLILHSEPTGYFNLPKIARYLRLRHFWLTNLFGKLSPDRLNAFYKLCSFYVQPSYSEGFGLPVLEAFRFHKPVIAVDAQPFNEIIRQNENGILVPHSRIVWHKHADQMLFKVHRYRARDLADAVLDLLKNQEGLKRMQRNIEQEKHNWSMHRLYPELLRYFT